MKEEYALTILLSNPILDEMSLKRIEHILKHPIDWNKIFLISLYERTTFIICKNLLQFHYFWMVPDQLWLVWNAAYMGNTKRNKQFLYYYEILMQEFSQKTIFAIPSGGIMLLTSIYENMLGIRLLHDLDFFTEKEHLLNIDKILYSLDFKKIYINNKDFLINPNNIIRNNILYSKYQDETYINCDFCSGMEGNQNLFTFLIDCMKSQKNIENYIAQIITLYLSVAKSWNGNYCISNIKHYTYARLIDLHLYQKMYTNFEITTEFNKTEKGFYITEIIQDVDAALNFFKKEGYLT